MKVGFYRIVNQMLRPPPRGVLKSGHIGVPKLFVQPKYYPVLSTGPPTLVAGLAVPDARASNRLGQPIIDTKRCDVLMVVIQQCRRCIVVSRHIVAGIVLFQWLGGQHSESSHRSCVVEPTRWHACRLSVNGEAIPTSSTGFKKQNY